MNWRKFIAVIMGILTFVGVIVLIGIVVRSYWPDYSPSEHPVERLSILFVSFFVASTVYNLIKGEEQEIKEKKKVCGEKISQKLKEVIESKELKSFKE